MFLFPYRHRKKLGFQNSNLLDDYEVIHVIEAVLENSFQEHNRKHWEQTKLIFENIHVYFQNHTLEKTRKHKYTSTHSIDCQSNDIVTCYIECGKANLHLWKNSFNFKYCWRGLGSTQESLDHTLELLMYSEGGKSKDLIVLSSPVSGIPSFSKVPGIFNSWDFLGFYSKNPRD